MTSALPIEEVLPQLRAALSAHANVVLQAPPGAGKSTRVPLALLDEPWLGARKVVMLEPRRLAARAVAQRMAQTLGEPVGRTVGYRTRLESRVGKNSRIEVVTEGILTRRLQSDPALEDVALVVFDEFHERNLQADLGLALCLDAQATLRDDLKLLVMSATLDATNVSRLLGEAAIVTSAGRTHPVEVRWLESLGRAPKTEQSIEQACVATIARALPAHAGDVLVFLPGQAEIRRTQELAKAALPGDVHLLPLYGELSLEQQDEALRPAPDGRRKIVLATNIAETSLTIEGIRIVVDSGLARRAHFDPATGMSRLRTVRISRASADQRCGRAGRTAPGICFRLWTQGEHSGLAAQSSPEIAEADLAPLALDLANWGVVDPSQLRWLDTPPNAAYSRAQDLLRLLQAIDRHGRITPHGKQLASLGVHPRLAHMIVRSSEFGLQRLAVELAALLGERDILRFSSRERDADLRLRIEALRGGRMLGAAIEIDSAARQRVVRTADMLLRQLELPSQGSDHVDEEVGRLLAFAYPDRIAQSRGGGRFQLTQGRAALLSNAQPLSKCEFIVVADLDAGERDARIRLAAPLARTAVEHDCAHRIETRERVAWESRQQAVLSVRERWLDALKIEEQRIDTPDAQQVVLAMITGIREMGLEALPWSKASRALRARLLFARRHASVPADWPDVSDAALLQSLDSWLAPWLSGITRREHLGRLDMHEVLQSMIDWQRQQRLNEFAPTHITVPSGSQVPINYEVDPPTLSVRLQEVFGMQTTPHIANGRVPLVMELLSPAHRPVQITQDLKSFWARGYADVKKDLKGRYPKHYWPDDPMSAQATARAKPRQR